MPNWIIEALGWIMALLSIAGWAVFCSRTLRLEAELSVPFAVCVVVLITFVGGLLGALQTVAWAAAGLGLAMAAVTLVRFRSDWRRFCTPGFAFLLLFAVFIAWQVRDDRLSHNDDFNHWAVIARNMLLRNALPDSSVTAIYFSSYPPGTALFVYYMNRIALLPFTEGSLILAQNLLEILLLSPLFLCVRKAFSGKGRETAPIYAMLFSCAVLMFLYEFRALVVDVVNGLVGFCCFAGILYLKDEPKKAAVYAAPLVAVGLLVKFANVYYAAWAMLALLYVNLRVKRRGGKPAYGLFALCALFCTLIAASWFLHVRAAYGGVADTHSMNLARILDVLRGWSAEDVQAIGKVCLYMATSLKKSSVLLTLFMNCAALALAMWNKFFRKGDPKPLLAAVAIADICYIGYQCMLFAAYLLSFSREEALRGASYGRYNMSVMIWIIGYLAIAIVSELGRMDKARAFRTLYGIGFAAMVALALIVTGEGATLYTEVSYSGTKQAVADRILAENAFTDTDTFFVLAADEDAYQVGSVFHYKVNRRVPYGNIAEYASIDDLLAAMGDSDYLIVLEDDPRISALLSIDDGAPSGAYRREMLVAAR